jgi:hypothetical protein
MSCACASSSSDPCAIAGDGTLCLPQGADWTELWEWQTGDPLAAPDLSEWTGVLTLATAGQAPVLLTTENGGLTLGTAGSIRPRLTRAQIDAMAPVTWSYQLTLNDGTTTTRLLSGLAHVSVAL